MKKLSVVVLSSLAILSGCGDDKYPETATAAGGSAGKSSTNDAGAVNEAGSSVGGSASGGTTSAGAPSSAGERATGGEGDGEESSAGAPNVPLSSGGALGTGGVIGSAGEPTTTASGGSDASESGGTSSASGGSESSSGGSLGASGGSESSNGGRVSAEAGAGGESSPPVTAWYECQGSDRAFVRRAILGVLGRAPVSQAEVSLYTDLMQQVDDLDGFDPSTPQPPGAPLRVGRRAVLNALFARPEYASNWGDLYRDFLRVQRVDEQQNAACYGARARPNDATTIASWVRDMPPTGGNDGKGAFTMADVIAGSIDLDDMTPIYTTNLFSMITKTYAGANAEKVALELSRRRDTGAWFDAVYLNRDTVCLNCHNSEFSVTQTNDPTTNRHYPVGGQLEKAIFGLSTGPSTYGGYEGGDRLHATLRYTQLVNDCAQLSDNAASQLVNPPKCATGEKFFKCRSDDAVMCASDPRIPQRHFSPWGWATACGQYMRPEDLPVDMAFVESRLGNVSGLRTSVWDLWTSLRSGFDKLKYEGLGVAADGTVSDPDKALAYLTSMNIAEKVWREVVGTPLTIPTYFPRNAASRDQLQLLTETFISSGYSNKALLEEIFASPYVNLAPPDSGCGAEYGAPRIFDPWVTAEEDPARRGNSTADGAVSLSSRTVARAAYSALGWPLAAYGSMFPNVKGYGQDSVSGSGDLERQFQDETGFFLKNSSPGFRGFDFQARLGWEDRMGRCGKLAQNTQPDVIDDLVARTALPGVGSVRDVLKVLKDRITGNATLDDPQEEAALESIIGAPLDVDASTLLDANASLRRVCGVMISSPQFMMIGVSPKDTLEVPTLTPSGARYGSLCEDLRAQKSLGFAINCFGDDLPLLVSLDP